MRILKSNYIPPKPKPMLPSVDDSMGTAHAAWWWIGGLVVVWLIAVLALLHRK